MRTCGKGFLAAGLLFAAASVFAQSALLETAKKLYDAKQFKECAQALEKEVQHPDANLELMQIAMNANLRAGNPISSSIIGGELLKRTKKPTLNMLYTAAEAARLAGDEKIALSRFHTFCLKEGAVNDKRFLQVAAYLLMRGRYPDVFASYVMKLGPATFTDEAISYLTWLADSGNGTQLVPYIAFMNGAYGNDPEIMRTMVDTIWNRRKNLEKTAEIGRAHV